MWVFFFFSLYGRNNSLTSALISESKGRFWGFSPSEKRGLRSDGAMRKFLIAATWQLQHWLIENTKCFYWLMCVWRVQWYTLVVVSHPQNRWRKWEMILKLRSLDSTRPASRVFEAPRVPLRKRRKSLTHSRLLVRCPWRCLDSVCLRRLGPKLQKYHWYQQCEIYSVASKSNISIWLQERRWVYHVRGCW